MSDPTDPAAPPAADPASPPATGASATPPADPPSDPPNPPADPADPPKQGEGNDPPVVPEAYDFTMPEGVELDAAAVEKYAPVFKELGLTQEQAQKLVDLRAAEIKAQMDGAGEAAEKWYAERRAAEIAEANTKGLEAIKADTELGGDKFDGVRSRVVEAIGAVATPEIKARVEALGLGNDPEIVRLVHRLIDYTPQDRGERPAGGGGSQQSTAHRMYPNMRG